MLVRVFFSTRYSVDDPRSDARSAPRSATLRPRYSVSSAATEPSRRPLMASTSATLLAFGTAPPPKENGRSRDRPTGACHAWRHLTVLRLRRRPWSGLRAMRQPDGLGQRGTVAQRSTGGCGQPRAGRWPYRYVAPRRLTVIG